MWHWPTRERWLLSQRATGHWTAEESRAGGDATRQVIYPGWPGTVLFCSDSSWFIFLASVIQKYGAGLLTGSTSSCNVGPVD